MKKLYIIVCLSLVAVLFGSCEDLLDAPNNAKYDDLPSVECNLNVQVGGIMVNNDPSSRASVPSGATETMSENEKKIHNLWVLQFVNDQLLTAGYYTISSKNELENLPIVLKKYDGYSNIIVVTNTNDPTWINSSIKTKSDFNYLSLNEPRPMYTSDLEGDLYAIPMAGEKIVITSKVTKVSVDVSMLYAKLKIKVKIRQATASSLYNIDISNIPWNSIYYNRTTSGDTQDSNAENILVPYPDDTRWISRSFNPTADGVSKKEETIDGETYDVYGDYVIYVPENTQGEAQNGNTVINVSKRNEAALTMPHPLSVSATIRKNESTENDKYTVYPGCDALNNFNVKRNRVYNVTVTLKKFTHLHQPSANCFVVKPGATLGFEPYYRTEIGGGYNFKNYLQDSQIEENPDPDKTIAKVKILWQTQGCIGDNTNGDKVYMQEDTELPAQLNGKSISRQKIYVKANKEGNAVIAAYNSKGTILWSWHIWVTDNEPDNVGNSVVYYTYAWDNSGINSQNRIPRYNLMKCNLGALSEDYPTSLEQASKCHGMLYQWGRKDPFPPISTMTNWVGGGIYHYTSDAQQSGSISNIHILDTYYGNDNKTPVEITGAEDGSKLFHSVSGNTIASSTAIYNNPVLYTVENPTVFMCGTKECDNLQPEGKSDDNYVKYTDNYLWEGDWYPQHDNKLWGAKDPTTDGSMNYLQVATARPYPSEEAQHYNMMKLYIFDNYAEGQKTIYDPCPSGWRVSPGDLWLGFSRTGMNPVNQTEALEDINYDDAHSAGWGMSMYVQDFRQGPTSYFPAQGLLFGNGTVGRANRCGNYHNATPDLDNHVNIVHIHKDKNLFHIFENTYYQMFVKSSGCPVRCVRESL